MRELIQRVLDVEESFLSLKTELFGEPGDSIDKGAALDAIQDMIQTLNDIRQIDLSN
jgi:hypothetical protein